MTAPVKTTCDAFLDGRIVIRQPARGFRSGLDAVFLAAACKATAGDMVLEAGCGAGAASLCLLARVAEVKVTGVEIDAGLAGLARLNAQANGCQESFQVINADITAPWAELETHGLVREVYDHVIANPPFFDEKAGRPPPDARRARACTMPEGGLDRWVRFLAAAAKSGAGCTIIHTADALHDLLDALHGRFGGLTILPLHPRESENAIRVIVTGVKGSRAPVSIRQGIILHAPGGSPTEAAKAVLREGKPID